MPYITTSGQLTLRVPTRGTEDWDSTFLSDFAEKISSHDHTGSGKGAQLGTGAIVDDAIDDRKIRLRNNYSLRARDAANNSDINLFKLNASDDLIIQKPAHLDIISNASTFTMTNNQATPANVTDVIADSSADVQYVVKYAAERLGTADLRESGILYIIYNGTDFDLSQEFIGDAGLTFSVTAGGQLQYISSNNTGSSSEKLHYIIETLGV